MAAILLRKRIRELVGGTFQCPVSGIMRFSVKSKSNNLFVVDSLAMVKRLEEEGISSKQAREITKLVTKVLNDAVVNVSPSIEEILEVNMSKFKEEAHKSQHNVPSWSLLY
ncbi:uncharacterized protein HKW66_Vig0180780 [Vigna angularis]|uniref:Uncharacterized protein n=1 Tax=Phaseolus angularis TaxID=3914 RepID=A0A8T0K4H0_PHAAN|nr:uncharacterized protein HKW66_Vig0180780 [Vigna angularis]